ncbi:ricin-type beta-trefoil lectin domain protein [Kitasatospora aureofaciens]|uniref:LamG-like jellyroll fold domain-containing protein n=1 Tax=Kitasatospora aureofaciens TaxID=1894 RepID=UPI001C439D9A|nr:LamG-like jellyroll fold domain-containing protein [Kitasatospora aureofaciens]MBV6697376.1 ricin-type beta-trefoil lectin domain protein [Kitasatospora aureofaciens]
MRRNRYPSRRSSAAAIGLALALASVGPIAPSAFADTAPPSTSAASSGLPAGLSGAITAGDAKFAGEKPVLSGDKAIAEAKKTGKSVPVPELTDESSETVATPDGHFSRTMHTDPQRVKQNGAWTALDGTLIPDGSGGYRPKAAVSGVRLSGGGAGPLATLTSPDGESLSMDSPFPLTRPVLDPGGQALIYPEVAPGVDLKVTTSKLGSLSTVLIVKTAEAAKNPALKKVRFPTTAKGVTVKADADNNLTATTTDGKVRWHASAPQMWDSSTGTPAATAPAKRDAAGASDDVTPGGSDRTSTAESPGPGAKIATMVTTATPDAVELTTDETILGKGQGPWFIDPGWLYDSRSANAWTWTQSAYPTTANIGRTVANTNDPYAIPGVGYQGYRTTKGVERSYFQFDTRWYNDIVINNATLSVWETQSSDYSCTTPYDVDLYLTNPIDNSTTWNNSPGIIGGLVGSKPVPGANHDGCSVNRQFDYDVTSVYQNYAPTRDSLAFGLFAHDETNKMAFKRLDYNPVVVVKYDRVPNTPSNPYASPAPTTKVPETTNQGCDGNSIGWMNSSAGFNGTVTLNATVSSRAQDSLYSWTHIWDYADLSADADSGLSALTPNNGVAVFQVKPGVIKDGHVYGWGAMATDGFVSMSASTPVCRFGVDLTPPTLSVPDIYSQLSDADLATRYPPSGNGQVTKKRVGETGLVPFTASDSTPAGGGNASGVACARWSWDPQFSGAGWACGSQMPQGAIPVTPGRWGTNILYIQVMDNARNISPVAQYAFYVPWNPDGPPPVFGDVTGDGAPDILLPDQAGYLRTYNAPGNPNVKNPSVTTVASPANAPGGQGWNNIQLAHRGTLTGGNNIDDVIAHAPGDPELNLYPNPGNTGAYGRIDGRKTLAKPACVQTTTENCSWLTTSGYNAKDWSNTLRVAALGDPVNSNLDPKLGFKNKTGLLTVESFNNGTDAALWYYPATDTNTLGKPVQLAASGWKDKELITPGDWAKQGHPGLWSRNLAPSADAAQGDLLAYTFTTGTVVGTTNQGQPIVDKNGQILMVPTLTQVTTTTKIGNIPIDGWPATGSDGDLTGNGNASLWGRKPDGTISIWWGQPTAANNPTAGYTWQAGPNTIANTAVNPLWWALDGRSSGDTGDNNPLYQNSVADSTYPKKAMLTTDHTGAPNKATVMDGATTYRSTNTVGSTATTPGLDTTQSYSVAAWVKLNSTTNYQTVVSLTGQERSPFYLQYSGAFGNWAFVLPGDDHYNTNVYYSAVDQTGRTKAQAGVWTHLVGTYNADTGAATLFVNGRAVGSTKVSTVWKTNGSLNVGNDVANLYPPGTALNGAISDVRVYPYALTDPQVNTVATTDSLVQIHSAINPGKCVDNWGGNAGALAAIYDCWNGDSQHLLLTSDNKIKNPVTGTCLGTASTPAVNGTQIAAQPCGDPAAQTWIRQYDGSIYNPASGRCIDVHGWDTTNGSALDIWDCVGSANQRWTYEAQTK